ncbi:MAG TPA: hypothetical protein VD993_04760 [Chitinophagaceae bacterium]|nr:hypothetical protein [Chitinophagaceae bacterium]
MTQDNRHIPQPAGEPHNQQTKPAATKDVDKLRENPHNDEKTIPQNPQLASQNTVESDSTFARKDDEGRNQVTNEQEQTKVVNPGEKKWESSANEDQPGEEPEAPSKNPYEEIGDDPEEMRKKIPKM